jgi:hypothetical protein
MPKILEKNENGEHKILYSALGDDFLIFHEWALKNLTGEELEIMRTDPNFFQTEFGINCNTRWKREQKITSVHNYKNDVFVSSGGLGEENTYKFTVYHWWGVDSV